MVESLSQDERLVLQMELVLVGAYDRLIDGEFGEGTYRAITSFEREQGRLGDGVLRGAERNALSNDARAVHERLGIALREDAAAGLGIYLPLNLLVDEEDLGKSFSSLGELARGTVYLSKQRDIFLATMQIAEQEASLESIYALWLEPEPGTTVGYSRLTADSFTVAGKIEGGSYYLRFYQARGRSVGYMLFWADGQGELGSVLATYTASMTYPLEPDGAHTPQDEPKDDKGDGRVSSGTGFFISSKGVLVTNHHVAGSCNTLEVAGHGPAKLIRSDEKLDLAVVQLDRQQASSWATIRVRPPDLAEPVVLLGFPLAQLLNSSLTVTTGIVSSETGSAGSDGWFTTNAGIQPGNSGGPLLDAGGNVIGVAVAKIDDVELLKDAGTTAPNVGFGISSGDLLEFLSIFQHMTTPGPVKSPLSPQEIANKGKKFTVQVICTE